MAGAIGRVTAAAAAVVNENQVSLINLNFDFTLVKREAPKEFGGLGSMMSLKRKTNAESGAFHRTARKLGALFEGSLPHIEGLMKAYGVRVSEIAQSDKVKTKDTRASELFANQIGPDSTSIWAAVTSGEAAVSVHLLACMLARVFPGPVATSIWVEVVAGQKSQIEEKQKTASFASAYDAASMAAKQEFSRDELAEWDNSARSWVQCGDQVMAKQHQAMMNMLDAAKISVNSETNTYKSVITAWIDALKAMSCLVSGTPQRVQNGAILLGLSAWHLYPDLVLLSSANSEVRQHDPLISNLGVLTIGLEDLSLPHDPVSWSLPLAYMRYYGEPSLITGLAGHSNSRVSIDQFAYIVIGSVISAWESSGFVKDIRLAVNILHRLSDFLKAVWTRRADVISQSPHGYQHLAKTSWLGQILAATDRYEDSGDDVERSTAMKLVSLGRRHPNLLCQQSDHPAPLFGISKFSHALGLMAGSERRVLFLRQLALSIGVDSSRYIIRYKNIVKGEALNEYATIQPFVPGSGHPESFIKRKNIPTGKNIRWLSITGVNRDPCGCKGPCTSSVDTQQKKKPCKCAPKGCSLLCHDWKKVMPSKCSGLYCYSLATRMAEVASYNEQCLPVHQCSFGQEGSKSESEICDFATGNDFDASVSELYIDAVADFHRLASTSKPKTKPQNEQPGERMGYKTMELLLNPIFFNQFKLALWFSGSKATSSLVHSEYMSSALSSEAYVSSLMACASAAEIYKLLPGATISTTIVSQSIRDALWVPTLAGAMKHPFRHQLSKAQTFACIAMLDTGTSNFDPNGLRNVFAISSGNSIYVGGPLLCDPYEIGEQFEVRHIAGNIGRPGLSLLVPPPNPKIRKLAPGTWNQLNYCAFDGKQENSFPQTSIHLSFTAYELPLQTELTDQHIIDRPARFIETLVQVFEGESWIADLDVIAALQSESISRFACGSTLIGPINPSPDCNKTFNEVFGDLHAMVSIDNWEEFLEQSEVSDMVIRAHKNWLARLAFTVTSVQQGRPLMLLPADPCWSCLSRKLTRLDATVEKRPTLIL
ncbi:MAG: hypothetical protein Q9226_002922 [Calogaya cf. arnoldii]